MSHSSYVDVTENLRKYLGPYDKKTEKLKVYTDTSDFFRISTNDIVSLGGRNYFIKGEEYEGRFGLDDPKYWVKKAIDIESDSSKIIKLVFFEMFDENVGGYTVKYARSPAKEARMLDIVKGHESFMQGFSIEDEKGNQVRILDRIPGKTLRDYIPEIKGGHLEYFNGQMPMILGKVLGCLEAIRFLHEKGEKHADIRSDHIIIESGSGVYKWIDFDLDYDYKEKPFGMDIFGVGNVLNFVVGKGIHNLVEIKNPSLYDPGIIGRLTPGDVSIVSANRVMNIKKVFPYIPDELNNILLHFARGTTTFYETLDEIIADLKNYLTS
jgi:tRNA A-37 threonylcarbamoyl transferase component Bud32